ncbi:stabilizer of axonemal microtubules 1 isoform X4 [Galleria mellonella]|uniref:Stabilizer of axonemal microtubules 1 isoform X4 n=1 Tax=Galleria mellonella TaxID=7137 RepID=A0ABM3N3P9_GALME|nr:stabilizer of axonemal microtubules 1 isoform X4 [Galleria mellonella]
MHYINIYFQSISERKIIPKFVYNIAYIIYVCIPCPAAAPCAPSAGIKSGLRDGQRIDGKQEQPCPCRTCCCSKPPTVKPCYKQPKIPDSYAPRRCYKKPTARVESGTTYNMSYLPVDGCQNLRGVPRKPAPNLVPSCEPMEGCTVQKLSFLPNPVCMTQPIRPCHHDMWGQGPMQNVTTQRHDYVPKPCVLRENFKPPAKFHCVEQPFENRTVNKLSYLPPERLEHTKSYAPERCYERPAAKMEGTTTQKMSYMPNQILPREPLPWACKGQYQKPCQRLDANTTYAMSYLDAKSDCRRHAIIPDTCLNPVTVSKRFETQTIYKNSYLPASTPIPQPMKPAPNLVPSTAQMEGDTVHKPKWKAIPHKKCRTNQCVCRRHSGHRGPAKDNIKNPAKSWRAQLSTVRRSYRPEKIVPNT